MSARITVYPPGHPKNRELTLADMSEKDLLAQVVDLAQLVGFKRELAYHTYDSRRSRSGFPDLTLVRERLVLAELKSEKGKPTPAQILWLSALLKAKAEVYLIRPRHLDLFAAVLNWRMPEHFGRGYPPLEEAGVLLEELRGEVAG